MAVAAKPPTTLTCHEAIDEIVRRYLELVAQECRSPVGDGGIVVAIKRARALELISTAA